MPPTRSALRRAARPRCRDQASPRGPAPAAAAARRAGWPAGVRPSFRPAGQEREVLGSRGRGAAGRGARLPPRGSQLLPPPSFGPQPGLPGAEGAALRHGRRWLPGFGGATGGRMAGQSEATLRSARPGPAPSAESPLEPRAPSGGELERAPRLPPARPPWPRAPRPLGRQTYSAAPAARATASQKSRGPGDTANLPGIFLGTREAPTCFKTKCEGRNSPTSCLFTTSPAA